MSAFDQFGGTLGNILSGMGGEQAGLVGGVLELLGKGEGGGLSGLVQAFQANGLGNIVSSWIGTGPNLPISADQIQEGLGAERVQQLGQRLGLPPDAVRAKLAEFLPVAVDKLTPNGSLPEEGLLEKGLGILRSRLG